MDRHPSNRLQSADGHTLVELVVVLALLGICLVAGLVSLTPGYSAQNARGAAQSWQAASAWAQTGVLWHGGSATVDYSNGSVDVIHDLALCGGSLGPSAPAVGADANVKRWTSAGGVEVTFGGPLASPDGGGSVYFDALRTRYRVIVRPVSGLTVRSLAAVAP